MDKLNVVVTGATGFIGYHLVKRLVEQGHSVTAITRKSVDEADTIISSLNDMGVRFLVISPNCGEQIGDILIQHFNTSVPDIIFHLASLFIASHSSADIEGLVQSNVLFGICLLEAIRVNNLPTRLISAGTSWQYDQEGEVSPANLYAATKQCFEVIQKYYSDVYKIPNTVLYIFDTYGTSDWRPKLLNFLIKAFISSKRVELSPGYQKIDLVHVSDIADGFMHAGNLSMSGNLDIFSRYALSSGETVSIRELVKIIERITNRDLPVAWGVRPYRDREIMIPWQANLKLPGWEPKIKLEDGLSGLFQDLDIESL